MELASIVDLVNGWVWGTPLVVLCLGAGVFFSFWTRFLQVRHIKDMVTQLWQGKTSESGISSFQGFAMALGGRVGTGNIAVSKRELARVKVLAGPLLDDPRFRDRLTRVEVELMALEMTVLRVLAKSSKAPGPEASVLKVRGTDIQQLVERKDAQAGELADIERLFGRR